MRDSAGISARFRGKLFCFRSTFNRLAVAPVLVYC